MGNWDDLKFVLALYRHRTMTAAAKAIGTNVATVSRRIERITERSATPLFIKVDGGWQATAAARGLIAAAEEFDSRVRAEENNAQDAAGLSPQKVRVTAMPFVHHSVLLPEVRKLRQARPNIRLSLRNKAESLGLGDTDIIVRFGRPEAGRLVARKVGDTHFHAFRPVGARTGSEWIGIGEEYDDRPTSALGAGIFGTEPTMRCDLFEHVQAAMHATGLPGIIPDVIGMRDAGLELLEEHPDGIEVEVWMAYHQSRRDDLALRAVADWIIGCFSETAWANVEDEVEIAAE